VHEAKSGVHPSGDKKGVRKGGGIPASGRGKNFISFESIVQISKLLQAEKGEKAVTGAIVPAKGKIVWLREEGGLTAGCPWGQKPTQ